MAVCSSFFTVPASVGSLPTIRREENDNRKEPEVCVERIRSGLYCMHSKWEKPQCKSNDDSMGACKKCDEMMPSSTLVDSVVQPQLSSEIGPTGLFGRPREQAVKVTFQVPASPKNGRQTLRAAKSSLFAFGSQSPQKFSFAAVNPVSSTQGNCAENGTADIVFGSHHQRVVYQVEFMIDGQSYVLKASFTKSATKIVGSLALAQVQLESSNASGEEESTGEGEKDAVNLINGIQEEDSTHHQLPSAIWANLNGVMTKIIPLNKSFNSDHHWESANFDGSFAYFERLYSVDEWKPWKPLTCSLWIEFETFSGGEKNVLKQLADMYAHQNHCDVQFTFKGDERVGGHVNILVARSPIFAAMFEHDMKEAATGEVVIDDVEPDIFKQLLHYIYSGRLLTALTEEATAQPLFVAADKYDINDLKEECVRFLLTCVRVENAINLLVWAHLHSVDELQQTVVSFMTLQGKEVCHLKEWEDLTKNYPDLCVLVTRRIIDRMCLFI